MKEITKEIILTFIDENKIELRSTHSKLCLPIINRICKKMKGSISFPPILIEGNVICDGHHRYVASLLAKYDLERIPGNRTSATEIIDWHLISFDEEDWDTSTKIDLLNKQDALYNNMSIEKIIEMLE